MKPWSLYFNCGAGDFLIIERYWSQEERQSLDAIHWQATCQPWFKPVLEASRAYRHVRHIMVKGEPPDSLRRCSLLRHLPVLHRREFYGSSFTREPLGGVPEGLPGDYVAIHATTPKNDAGQRSVRDMTPGEWSAVFAALDAWQLPGVVLNSVDENDTPVDPRLLNLSGKTNLVESLEIVKRSRGFVGIDSCLSVLAAEVLPADRLMIRTRNPFVVENRATFYPPHQVFPFLVSTMGGAAYPDNPPRGERTLVELFRPQLFGHRSYDAFDIIELPPVEASKLAQSGHGRIVAGLD